AGEAALWWMITHHGKALDIDTRGEQVLAFVQVCLVLVLIRYAPAISRYVKEIYYRRQAQKINVLPDEEGRITLTPPRHITVEEIRQEMCRLYGRHWPRKLRILLVTGSVADVEQLTPKLTQELWQEDQGTLLLWGGDPAAPADAAWLTALRKLRHRPVDGVVWVTSAFDRFAGSDAEPAAPLTPESMDALSHALKGRCDALGWKLAL
ncbi:type VI secretion protein VasK, partial [Enterobacter hormaechei]|nr:type VI secretion protein VasK [Enterobacter hormaechei]